MMDIADALEIVIKLARDSVEYNPDPKKRAILNDVIDVVEDYVVNQLGDD